MKPEFGDHVCVPDADPFDETLKGLQGLRVLIETAAIRPEVIADGFSVEVLQAQIETEVRGAGIRLLSLEEWEQDPRRPTLYVSPNVTKIHPYKQSDLSVYSYHLAVGVTQACELKIFPVKSFLLSTWSKSTYGVTNDLQTIRSRIGSLLSALIGAYRKVNRVRPHLALCSKPQTRKG